MTVVIDTNVLLGKPFGIQIVTDQQFLKLTRTL